MRPSQFTILQFPERAVDHVATVIRPERRRRQYDRARQDTRTPCVLTSSMQPENIPPNFDITVRVGCSLVYEVTGTASLLLNLKLHPDRNHALVFEALTLGNNL